jgi:hypothetical protein
MSRGETPATTRAFTLRARRSAFGVRLGSETVSTVDERSPIRSRLGILPKIRNTDRL